MKLDKVKNVIFDLDGTLIDSDVIYEKGWRKAFDKYGIDISNQIIEGWGGLSVNASTKQIAEIVGDYKFALELREIREEYFYEQLMKGNLKTMPFALELLEFLNKEKITINLATSTHREKGLMILKKLELSHYFTNLLFGDQVEKTKPNPEIYLRTLDELDSNNNETVVIEDSVTGMSAAVEAELPVFLVPYRPMKADGLLIKKHVTIKNNLSEVLNEVRVINNINPKMNKY
ncbi:HAD family hydrolase [Fundicoccus sp. Sow4_F4]|uniref:HAD family hydrolase n=1 Tax=Fundicoccus sp. Sow4_F4 TaxID=3438783 RepID=UPI003F93CA33